MLVFSFAIQGVLYSCGCLIPYTMHVAKLASTWCSSVKPKWYGSTGCYPVGDQGYGDAGALVISMCSAGSCNWCYFVILFSSYQACICAMIDNARSSGKCLMGVRNHVNGSVFQNGSFTFYLQYWSQHRTLAVYILQRKNSSSILQRN